MAARISCSDRIAVARSVSSRPRSCTAAAVQRQQGGDGVGRGMQVAEHPGRPVRRGSPDGSLAGARLRRPCSSRTQHATTTSSTGPEASAVNQSSTASDDAWPVASGCRGRALERQPARGRGVGWHHGPPDEHEHGLPPTGWITAAWPGPRARPCPGRPLAAAAAPVRPAGRRRATTRSCHAGAWCPPAAALVGERHPSAGRDDGDQEDGGDRQAHRVPTVWPRAVVRIPVADMARPYEPPSTEAAPAAPVACRAVEQRSYVVRTFGCQMNEHDSERIAGLLEADGLVAGRATSTTPTSSCSTRAASARTPTTSCTATSATSRRGRRQRDGRQIVVSGLPGPEGPRRRAPAGPPTSTS